MSGLLCYTVPAVNLETLALSSTQILHTRNSILSSNAKINDTNKGRSSGVPPFSIQIYEEML